MSGGGRGDKEEEEEEGEEEKEEEKGGQRCSAHCRRARGRHRVNGGVSSLFFDDETKLREKRKKG
jgi:hypothetical protein